MSSPTGRGLGSAPMPAGQPSTNTPYWNEEKAVIKIMGHIDAMRRVKDNIVAMEISISNMSASAPPCSVSVDLPMDRQRMYISSQVPALIALLEREIAAEKSKYDDMLAAITAVAGLLPELPV